MENKPVMRFKKPIILKKKSPTSVSFIREEVIYDTSDVHFLKGEFQRMMLVNHSNLVNKSSRTVAKFFAKDGSVLEKNSDKVTQIIGQEPYNTVLTALCSIIDQELKVRSILSLLTAKTTYLKGDRIDTVFNESVEKSCQTDEIRIEMPKCKPQRRIRKQAVPYIVKDVPEEKKIRKVIVNIPNCSTKFNSEISTVSSESTGTIGHLSNNSNKVNCSVNKPLSDNKLNTSTNIQLKRNSTESLLDLGYLHDDFSSDSIGKFSTLSEASTLVDFYIDQHTKNGYLQNNVEKPMFRIPGTDIDVPYKPEDMFHIVTKENYQYLNTDRRKKLLVHQMKLDSEYCQAMDADGNFPIHLAVINNDMEFLIRQCVVLKMNGSSVDILANGLTPLKLSLYQETPHNAKLAVCLLRHGADPLRTDDEHRACTHLAAERDANLLKAILNSCHYNARKILSECDELWKPEMETKTDDELATILIKHMCSMFDKSGYTPLMLASMLGLYENVRILLEHSPSSVNDKMPTNGNTALYLAVAAAYNSSAENGDKSKVLDHFRNTIEILVENGANPFIDNDSGINVNTLIHEFNCAELSMLVANQMTLNNFSKNDNIDINASNYGKMMLLMDKKGNIEYKSLENEKRKKSNSNAITTDNKKTVTTENEKIKPIIVENILLKPLNNTANKPISSETNPNCQIVDESTKIGGTLKKVENKNVFILSKQKLEQGKLKRKILTPSIVTKLTKIEK